MTEKTFLQENIFRIRFSCKILNWPKILYPIDFLILEKRSKDKRKHQFEWKTELDDVEEDWFHRNVMIEFYCIWAEIAEKILLNSWKQLKTALGYQGISLSIRKMHWRLFEAAYKTYRPRKKWNWMKPWEGNDWHEI